MRPEVSARIEYLIGSGRRSPDDIINDARRPDSPLHTEFEWEPEKAHAIYLKDRARALIRQWYVENIGGQELNRKIRGAWSIPVAEEDDDGFVMRTAREYYTIDEVFESPDLTLRLLQTALAELNALRRKYNALKQLADVFEAVDRVEHNTSHRPRLKAQPAVSRPGV